jgi:AcrR family transcriptional regulator
VERAEFDIRYSGLEDCFVQVYDRLADEFLARVTDAFESEEGWRNQLRAAAYATLRHIEEDPARNHFAIVEVPHAGERAQLIRDRVFATLSGFIDRGRLEPGAPAEVSAATAESLNGAVFQHMLVATQNRSYERQLEILPELMYAVVLTYQGPEAAAEELNASQALLVGAADGA